MAVTSYIPPQTQSLTPGLRRSPQRNGHCHKNRNNKERPRYSLHSTTLNISGDKPLQDVVIVKSGELPVEEGGFRNEL